MKLRNNVRISLYVDNTPHKFSIRRLEDVHASRIVGPCREVSYIVMGKGAVRSPKERHLHGHFLLTFLCAQYTTNILRKSDYFNYDTLRILEFLYCHNGTKFTYLQKRLDMSSGSLINRLRKLKDAEYIFQKLYTYESGKHEVRYTLTISRSQICGSDRCSGHHKKD